MNDAEMENPLLELLLLLRLSTLEKERVNRDKRKREKIKTFGGSITVCHQTTVARRPRGPGPAIQDQLLADSTVTAAAPSSGRMPSCGHGGHVGRRIRGVVGIFVM